MPKHWLFGARVEDQRIVLETIRRAERALRRLNVRWQRIVAPLLHLRGIKFELAGLGAESHFPVLAVVHRHFYPVRFVAQLIPCNAKRLQRLLGEFLKRREVFLEAELAAKSDDELPVRLALAQGDQFLRHSVEESRFRPLGQQMQTRLIALQIAGGGAPDVSGVSG